MLVVSEELGSSIVFGDPASRRLVLGEPIALAVRVLVRECSVDSPSGVAAEAGCECTEGPLSCGTVAIGAGEATSPGLAVAPAVPVASVPASLRPEAATA